MKKYSQPTIRFNKVDDGLYLLIISDGKMFQATSFREELYLAEFQLKLGLAIHEFDQAVAY